MPLGLASGLTADPVEAGGFTWKIDFFFGDFNEGGCQELRVVRFLG